jgi:hypothetical protein
MPTTTTSVVSLTCTHCKALSIVPDTVGIAALILWECVTCGDTFPPVFSIRPMEAALS